MNATLTAGTLLRQWREHRRLSQLTLALNSNISTRHLSFLETGRSAPSREMILLLAEELQIPLRQRNVLMHAAGYAPAFPERSMSDASLQVADSIVHQVLTGQEPNPALAFDSHWNITATNHMVGCLLQGVDTSLMQPPMNAIRLSLHPLGLAPRIANFAEWHRHTIARLRQRIEMTADPALAELLREVQSYPAPEKRHIKSSKSNEIATSLALKTPHGELRFITTTMVFGSALDVTLSELAIECFFPEDAESTNILKKLIEGYVDASP